MVLEMRRMNGTIYTDLTGAFSVNSARGNKLLYIAYSYDANGILWEPTKSKNDSEMSRVFKIVYDKLEKRGINPKFHIMDNDASSTVMSWLERNKVNAQKVAPHNQRAKTAERIIETAKHHFICKNDRNRQKLPNKRLGKGGGTVTENIEHAQTV